MKLVKWSFNSNPTVQARHEWGLPGVNCDLCRSTWGSVGDEYPLIDLSPLPDATPYQSKKPVSNAEFTRLRTGIFELIGKEIPLPPGSDFGTLVGRRVRKIGDFAWARFAPP